MKKIILILSLMLLTWNISEAKNPYYHGRVTFHTFYYSLAPYGEWIEIDYGIYAWRPVRVYVGWAPYLFGRWVYTSYGWYWDSFEPFGWAVYHYGRWYYDDYYGWIWFPDYVWGPAWVEWRYTDLYIGWAPLPPYASFSISFGLRFSINWYSPHHYWHFVPVKYFCDYEVHRYVIHSKYKYRIYRDSRYSNDYRFESGRIINSGIDRNFVERKGGKVLEAKIEETTRLRDFTERKTDERNRVLIYRPDEREINRDVDIRVRKTERHIALDVNKIQTPRERIDIRERERRTEQIDRESKFDIDNRERIELRDRMRENNSRRELDNRKIFEERSNDFKRDESTRTRIENDRKPILTEERRNSPEFGSRQERDRYRLDRRELDRSREETRFDSDRKKNNSQPDFQRKDLNFGNHRQELNHRERDLDGRTKERNRIR